MGKLPNVGAWGGAAMDGGKRGGLDSKVAVVEFSNEGLGSEFRFPSGAFVSGLGKAVDEPNENGAGRDEAGVFPTFKASLLALEPEGGTVLEKPSEETLGSSFSSVTGAFVKGVSFWLGDTTAETDPNNGLGSVVEDGKKEKLNEFLPISTDLSSIVFSGSFVARGWEPKEKLNLGASIIGTFSFGVTSVTEGGLAAVPKVKVGAAGLSPDFRAIGWGNPFPWSSFSLSGRVAEILNELAPSAFFGRAPNSKTDGVAAEVAFLTGLIESSFTRGSSLELVFESGLKSKMSLGVSMITPTLVFKSSVGLLKSMVMGAADEDGVFPNLKEVDSNVLDASVLGNSLPDSGLITETNSVFYKMVLIRTIPAQYL